MLKCSLPLEWKENDIKMPTQVFDAQSVVLGGKVYIGGGVVGSGDAKVLEYTIKGGGWREIETPTSIYSIAVASDKLILAGGKDSQGSPTNQVWEYDSNAAADTLPWKALPAMPTARLFTSAMGYKRWVFVVGGQDSKCLEVLDTGLKKWYSAASLPTPAGKPSLSVLDDTLYVAWGNTVTSASIPMLISDALDQSATGSRPCIWNPLPNPLENEPALVPFHGNLLAVGGWDKSSSTIAMYLPLTGQWLKVAELPKARRGCSAIFLPDTEEMMVTGGGNTIDICCIKEDN